MNKSPYLYYVIDTLWRYQDYVRQPKYTVYYWFRKVFPMSTFTPLPVYLCIVVFPKNIRKRTSMIWLDLMSDEQLEGILVNRNEW